MYISKEDFDPRKHIDYDAGADPEIKGAECQGCARLYTFASGMFDRNSAYKLGYEPVCVDCRKAPKLSIEEHLAKLREQNFNSESTKRQRHEDQEQFRLDRRGRTLDCSLFLQKLLHLVPNLYVTEGGIVGDLALYVTAGLNRSDFGGNSFKYLGYVTLGMMPEFSEYQFDEARDVMIRATKIGWREVLLRFIRNGILTEEQCNSEFGPPSGGVNSTWYKNLHRYRNSKKI